MLFVLTGQVQTGKTRWLQDMIKILEGAGVECHGVLAPGVWHERSDEHIAALKELGELEPSRYEKLGFNNVLLPQGKVVPMARRRDIAQAEGSYVPSSQSAQANLSWEMSEEGLARVNEHLRSLQGLGSEAADRRLLVIDEVGRLELLRNGGLTAALDLLDAGPTPAFAHVLIVVREALIDRALERFGYLWDGVCLVQANDDSLDQLACAFGLDVSEA
ncbi:MAG: hypothetical protein IKL97_00275 [Eggerthellaceae bacterium]|nr:hypothetical protein [Eggerthellaceae bacterium]